MRALVLTGVGPPDEVLAVQDLPEPRVGPGQVRIAVRACGLNFADLIAREGLYPGAPEPPAVMGYEVAGDVESVGPGVVGVEPGRRVFAATRFGGFADLATAAVDDVLPLPDAMTYEEGAALPINYGTAYAAVVAMAGVRSGETVLVHAASGGVGIACLQLLSDIGAVVIGTASAFKHDAIRAQGAQHAIDYRTQDVRREVARITGGEGVDVVLDVLGQFRESYSMLRRGGRLVALGASNVVTAGRGEIRRAVEEIATIPEFDGLALLNENKAVMGLNLLWLWESRGSLAELTRPLVDLIERGVVRPVVAGTFPFERAAEAHHLLRDRRNVGKVVLVP